MSLEHAPQRQERAGWGFRPLMTEVEVAEALGVTPASLRNARANRRGDLATLGWIRVGRLVRYRPETLEAWLAKREREAAA
jgi:hypothetical protein